MRYDSIYVKFQTWKNNTLVKMYLCVIKMQRNQKIVNTKFITGFPLEGGKEDQRDAHRRLQDIGKVLLLELGRYRIVPFIIIL